ncbi:hypothetical protein HMPREF1985_01456 [Mitsuokella sp. oral taxon 131 str. W9106]|nr:hypothetical protein HMPREF1985_01456 [Mitsuokella sp. oral taxon 131 str. W9106]
MGILFPRFLLPHKKTKRFADYHTIFSCPCIIAMRKILIVPVA